MHLINRLLAPFAAYPRWLVYPGLALAVVIGLWIVAKTLKWTFYVVVFAIVVIVALSALLWIFG
jgi:hypothetical protein